MSIKEQQIELRFDPEFAKKLDETLTNLDEITKGINAGEGTAGALVKNRSLYDHLDQTAGSMAAQSEGFSDQL